MIPYPLPTGIKTDVQIFNVPSTSSGLQVHTWTKPPWATMAYMLCIGGGGGGGGGFTRAASAAGGGGGGGGSSGQSRLVIPTIFLPDTLFVEVGAGGQGVASGGGTAGTGGISFISLQPNATSLNAVLASANAGATGGGTGTGAAVGAAGTGATAVTIGNSVFSGLGVYQFLGGQSGVAGGAVAGANGTANTIPTTGIMTMGGTGGAGTTSADFAGGAITASADSLISQMRPATPAAGSFNGSGGYFSQKPFFSFPGLGGSSSNTSTGGAGGNGAYGSGGGGGGAGTTGGRGGNGGGGYVAIISW